jgi:hypothetical protein
MPNKRQISSLDSSSTELLPKHSSGHTKRSYTKLSNGFDDRLILNLHACHVLHSIFMVPEIPSLFLENSGCISFGDQEENNELRV